MHYDTGMQQLNINLLPWRSRQRIKSGRHYFLLIFGMSIGIFVVATQSYYILQKDISQLQNVRQRWRLDAEVQKLYQKIEQTISHNKQVRGMLQRIEKKIPDGVILNKVIVDGGKIIVSGEGESASAIKKFMSLFKTTHLLSLSSRSPGVTLGVTFNVGILFDEMF